METWTFECTPDVEAFIEALPAVPKAQIRADIRKLETRGTKAKKPLVGHYDGDVYYIRSKVRGEGVFRLFYFRDGKRSFLGVHLFRKKSGRITGKERRRIENSYERITGKSLR